MKALVLAGGVGSRLRPFSHTMAKQVVPVANKPILLHCLQNIRDAGIRQVGIVVGSHADDIRRVAGSGAQLGLEVTYLPQEAPLGLAHCVLIARDFLGDEDFVMYLGDNVVPGGISGVLAEFREQRPDALLMVTKVLNPAEYGVAEVAADGRVVQLAEKSAAPPSDLAVIGVYVFTPEIHQAVRAIKPSWRNEREITDAIQWLVSAGADIRAHRHEGYWQDTGRIQELLECNRTLLGDLEPRVAGKVDAQTTIAGSVQIDETARVSRSRLSGPLIIGPDTTITDSYVGPYTSIGADCVLDGAAVEDSIVMEGACIQGVRHIRDSVIGREARVRSASHQAGGHQLIIGDHGRLLLSS